MGALRNVMCPRQPLQIYLSGIHIEISNILTKIMPGKMSNLNQNQNCLQWLPTHGAGSYITKVVCGISREMERCIYSVLKANSNPATYLNNANLLATSGILVS